MYLRPATPADIGFVWHCRQELDAGIARSATSVETFANHSTWMAQAIVAKDRLFLIAVEGAADEGTKLGYFRTDPKAAAWIVSLCLQKAYRGRGYARPVLAAGCDLAKKTGFSPLLADIHRQNAASRRVFQACGFQPLASNTPYKASLNEGFDRFIYIDREGTPDGC